MNFLKSRDWANKVDQDQTAHLSECLRLLVFSALNCLISGKHLRTKVTPDLHLIIVKTGEIWVWY